MTSYPGITKTNTPYNIILLSIGNIRCAFFTLFYLFYLFGLVWAWFGLGLAWPCSERGGAGQRLSRRSYPLSFQSWSGGPFNGTIILRSSADKRGAHPWAKLDALIFSYLSSSEI